MLTFISYLFVSVTGAVLTGTEGHTEWCTPQILPHTHPHTPGTSAEDRTSGLSLLHIFGDERYPKHD